MIWGMTSLPSGCRPAQAASIRRELGSLAFDGRDLVLADLLAPCFELRELFGRVVRLAHPHHLHDLGETRSVLALRGVDDAIRPAGESLGALQRVGRLLAGGSSRFIFDGVLVGEELAELSGVGRHLSLGADLFEKIRRTRMIWIRRSDPREGAGHGVRCADRRVDGFEHRCVVPPGFFRRARCGEELIRLGEERA